MQSTKLVSIKSLNNKQSGTSTNQVAPNNRPQQENFNLEVSDSNDSISGEEEEEDDRDLEDDPDEIEHGIEKRIDELSPIDKNLVKV